jgi:hypothetical protein
MILRPLCCSLLLAACATPPPEPPPPTPLAPHLLYRYGPALAGPLPQQTPPAPATVPPANAPGDGDAAGMHWHIEVRRVAAGAGSPLAAFAETVVRPEPAAQFAAFPRRLASVRVAPAAADADAPPAFTFDAPLLEGITALLDWQAAGAASPFPRLLCTRAAADSARLGLALGGEFVLLKAPLRAGERLELRFPDRDGTDVAVRTALVPGATDAERRTAVQQADAAARDAAAAVAPADAAALELAAQSRTMQQLVYVEDRRFALFGIASGHRAEICLDFLLCADAAAIGRLLDGIRGTVPSGGSARFALDRESLRALLPPLEAAEVPAEQRAFLLRTCGAVGRDASTLDDVLSAATDPDDLQERLRVENLDILHENDPIARVYAFEWLRAHGAAPDGFDPLGNATARRHALDRAAKAPHSTGPAPTVPPTGPPSTGSGR